MKKEVEPQLEINKIDTVPLSVKSSEEIEKVIEQNKPTEEEIKAAELELTEAQVEWNTSLWEIGTSEKGQEYIDYLRHYISHRFLWTQNAWMGVIKLEEELNLTEITYKKDTSVSPKMGSQAVEFIHFAFQNPGGTGFQSAKNFEEENEIYVEMFEIVGKSVEKTRKKLEDIKFLTDKYAAYQQGLYYEKEPTNKEMEGSYFDDDLNRFVKPGEPEYNIKTFMKKIEEEYGKETANKVSEDMKKEKEELELKKSIGPPIEK